MQPADETEILNREFIHIQNSIYVSIQEDIISFDLGRIECKFPKGIGWL